MKTLDYKGVSITWEGHASFKIRTKNLIIYIDPFQILKPEKADLILITHGHYDHCSIADIEKITKKDTVVVAPADCSSTLSRLQGLRFEVVEPYSELEIKNVKISTIPAYNVNKQFHKKINNWVGYVLEVENVRIYHSGDTDVIDEMKDLNNIDVALLCVGGTYTMNAREAAEAANVIKPKIAIPMHYGSIVGDKDDALLFKKLANCEVKILD